MGRKIRDVLNDLLVDMFNQILTLEENFLKERGIALSMSEVHTLEAIDKSVGKTMSEVAKRLRITQGTLTVNINRLTNKGFVYRVQDEKDRRIYRLKLTDKSRSVLDIHDVFHGKMIDQLVSKLSMNEKELLVESLSQLNLYFENLIEE
ncbi:MAG TPA: MarR family transcriptional regulator [Erysipelothrix sp.]|nr:MarR family transcriptional regulator [Erysipelothrix sp.]